MKNINKTEQLEFIEKYIKLFGLSGLSDYDKSIRSDAISDVKTFLENVNLLIVDLSKYFVLNHFNLSRKKYLVDTVVLAINILKKMLQICDIPFEVIKHTNITEMRLKEINDTSIECTIYRMNNIEILSTDDGNEALKILVNNKTLDGVSVNYNQDIIIDNYAINTKTNVIYNIIPLVMNYEVIYDIVIKDEENIIELVDLCINDDILTTGIRQENLIKFANIDIAMPLPLISCISQYANFKITYKTEDIIDKKINLNYNGIFLSNFHRRRIVRDRFTYMGYRPHEKLVKYSSSYKFYKKIKKIENFELEFKEISEGLQSAKINKSDVDKLNNKDPKFNFFPFVNQYYVIKNLKITKINKMENVKYYIGNKMINFKNKNKNFEAEMNEIPTNTLFQQHLIEITHNFKKDTLIEMIFDVEQLDKNKDYFENTELIFDSMYMDRK